MDKASIEKFAVNAVEDIVNSSDHLSSFIADNDKEPSWDGFIYVYNSPTKKKSELNGRLPVQVKGSEKNDHSKTEISFSMELSDLTNYLNDGGIILFVVYVGKMATGLKKTVYYIELPPVKLSHLMSGLAPHQKTLSLRLKKLPSNAETVASIVLNCLNHCRSQKSFANHPFPSLEQLEQEGLVEGLSTTVSGFGINSDYIGAFLTYDTYMYAKIKGLQTPIPLDHIMSYKVISTEKNVPITVAGKLYYNKYTETRTTDGVFIKIGSSFTLSFRNEKPGFKCDYKVSDSLRAYLVDQDFMLACIENQGFEINGCEIPLPDEKTNLENFGIDNQKKHFAYFAKLNKLLVQLGCTEDLDISSFTSQDFRNIERLFEAFIEKKPVHGLSDGLPLFATINISNLKILVGLQPCSDVAGTYTLYDFFETELGIVMKKNEESTEVYPVPQCALICAQDYIDISNIQFSKLLSKFKSFSGQKEISSSANNTLLELLLAYDKSKDNRKGIILATAESFADWLYNLPEDEFDRNIALLNKMQVAIRLRALNEDETKALYRVIEDSSSNQLLLTGAYILLAEYTLAELHFAKLSADEQEAFLTYPIVNLWPTKRRNEVRACQKTR